MHFPNQPEELKYFQFLNDKYFPIAFDIGVDCLLELLRDRLESWRVTDRFDQ